MGSADWYLSEFRGKRSYSVTNHDPVRRNHGNGSPRHGGELQQALRDVARSQEERRIRFDLDEQDAGTAVNSGSSRGGERGDETNIETVPSPVSDIYQY